VTGVSLLPSWLHRFKKGAPVAEVKAKFEGQVVAWEGEVRDVGKLIKLKMPANKLTLSNGGAAEIEYLVLEPLGENAKKWAAVPAGSRVRFRTTLKSSLFPVVTLLQGVGENAGKDRVIISTHDGELVAIIAAER
jgi:hypothetical protein